MLSTDRCQLGFLSPIGTAFLTGSPSWFWGVMETGLGHPTEVNRNSSSPNSEADAEVLGKGVEVLDCPGVRVEMSLNFLPGQQGQC